MSDLLKTGALWLTGVQRKWTSSRVTLTRGASSGCILAMRGRVVSGVDESSGMMTGETRQDWIIKVSDYSIDGIIEDPKPGDRIEDADGEIFEVMGFPGQKCFEPGNSFNTQHRIHTKHVDTAP